MQALDAGKDRRSDASASHGGVSLPAGVEVPAAAGDVREVRAGDGQGGSGAAIVAVLPIRAHSTLNAREHWAVRSRRAKSHRETAHWALKSNAAPALPCVVTLTRVAPRDLDTDNLAASMKNVRDGVADWLGVDDRDARVTWRCEQRRGKPHEYAVEVNIQ